jgi:hypothetical protein
LSLVISVQMLLFECNDSFGFYVVLVFCLLSFVMTIKTDVIICQQLHILVPLL